MNQHLGFSLIKLTVMLMILGILTVIAAPRFLNLHSEARMSALEGLKSAMQNAAGVVHAQAEQTPQATRSAVTMSLNSGSQVVEMVFGYPAATSAGIGHAVAGLSDTATWRVVSTSATSISYGFRDDSEKACVVRYVQPSSAGEPPQIITSNAEQC
ncbi:MULTISPECIES: type II secretion system protein [Vibrio]|uniref:MSHA pilin protein MshA n=1 Tax=Vibrio proteolyticus NBRC 13287 TaxID=1219065 RepID=U3A5D3_VIBPR|nr:MULTISPECIES: hypothetical protein [Vibrio]NAX22102.1 MSHA biogenesis protein MshA [Vibrio sp. V39_P1S14PM300]GAD68905.1 hypothetical protein VPR01S_20_00850 [Vibrio proteolyticus NBRC 13287]